MTLDALANRLAPDLPETLKRFPLAIILAGIGTLVLIGSTTQLITDNQDFWGPLILGLSTGAIFATGGALFAEGRRPGSILGLVVAYLIPVATIAVWQFKDTTWLVPVALPVIGTLWTSVAASTGGWRGAARAEAEDRFWWLNHLAIASAAIVGIAYLVVLVGTFAIGQTVDVLFGVDLSMPLYKVALPAIGGFFAPLYWLSTLPRGADYQPGRLDAPDFLIRAVAMIGKFVLIPLLLAYAAILLLYAVQIVLTQQLPEGMLGWMVLGFVTTGAGAWLVLHPEFLRDSIIVRFFRRWWFWATVVPLVLYAVAVQVRIDAYGFTPERLMLVWGGAWATSLTALFLLRRGDIRLIPASAAVCLLLATVGPWNVVGLSRTQQSATFHNLLPLTGPNGESYGVTPNWTAEEDARARGAVQYLVQTEEGREAVRGVLRLKGFDLTDKFFGVYEVIAVLGVLDPNVVTRNGLNLVRNSDVPIDVSNAPLYVGEISIYNNGRNAVLLDLAFGIAGSGLDVSRDGVLLERIDLSPWFAASGPVVTPDGLTVFDGEGRSPIMLLTNPSITFQVEGRPFLLLAESMSIIETDGGIVATSVYGRLFAGPIPPAPPPAAEPTAQDQPAPAT